MDIRIVFQSHSYADADYHTEFITLRKKQPKQ